MKTILIDGDMLAYRNSAALQDSLHTDWGDGVVSSNDQSWKGHGRMDGFIERMKKTLWADRAVVCMSSARSFRKNLCPAYKSNRNEKAEPELRRAFEDYLREKHKAIFIEGLEADDVMGIMATDPEAEGTFTLVTIDKDLRQIPGSYCNPYPPDGSKPKEVTISLDEGDNFFIYQTLVGDVIDGYKGCRGIGPKRAHDLIKTVRQANHALPLVELWNAVVKVYIAKGMTAEDALMNARMARILRHEDYDKQTGVKLWAPPTTTTK